MLILFMKILIDQIMLKSTDSELQNGNNFSELKLLILYYQYYVKKKTFDTYFKIRKNDP